MSFAQALFERVSLAALFLSSSYRSLFLRHQINLTVHSREFPFLHLPFNDFIFTTMPSTFLRNDILDVKRICYKKRGDEWSLRAFASMPSTAIFLRARVEIQSLLCELASNAKIWEACTSKRALGLNFASKSSKAKTL